MLLENIAIGVDAVNKALQDASTGRPLHQNQSDRLRGAADDGDKEEEEQQREKVVCVCGALMFQTVLVSI